MSFDRKSHWEHIYSTKGPKEVSWFQKEPKLSFELIQSTGIGRDAAIIDVGGGDSRLIDTLLDAGYTDLTVLDVSKAAIKKAQTRLDTRASQVDWIVADVAEFVPQRKYMLWHDRAAFHFLTSKPEIDHYIGIASEHIQPGGNLILGTFSTDGPEKCSGIPVQQYTTESLPLLFSSSFTLEQSLLVDHTTPFDTVQNFVFCVFAKDDIA